MASKKVTLASLASQMQKGFAALSGRMTKGFASADEKLAAVASDLAEIKETLDEHTQTLADHTRRLTTIENDVKTSLDKRLQLEVRVTNVEKKIFGASQETAA
jgi:chromosome segregation ATPase